MSSAGDGDSVVYPSGNRGTQSESSSQDTDMALAPPDSDIVNRSSVRMESPTVLESGGICAPNDGSILLGCGGNECSTTDQASMEARSVSRQNVEESMTHSLKISGASSFPMVTDDRVGDGSVGSSLGEKIPPVVFADSGFGDVIDTLSIPSMAHDPHFQTEDPSLLESARDIEPEQIGVIKDGSMPLECGGNECSTIAPVSTDSQEKNVEESVTHNLKPSGASPLSIVEDDHAVEGGPGESLEILNGKNTPLIVADSGFGDEIDIPNVSSLSHDSHFHVEAHSVLESTKDIQPEQVGTFKDSADNIKLENIGNESPPRHQIIGNHINVYNSSTCEDTDDRVLVDTASPFESVKEAVSRFGGIVDWKAHKIHTAERQKLLQQELEKAHEEIPVVRKLLEASEHTKLRALAELAEADIAVEQLKLNLDRAETEERQAKHDSDLLRKTAADLSQGIPENASLALKSLLELITSRCTAAASDLSLLKEEIHSTARKYTSALAERDASLKRANAAISTVRLTDQTLQKLAADLITVKESALTEFSGSIQIEHEKLNSALKSAEVGVQNLKNEAEIICSDLEKEKSAVDAVRRREGIASVTVASLEAELARIRSEISRVRAEEKAYVEETAEMPKKLQEAALEGDVAESEFEKSMAELHLLSREVELIWADHGVISNNIQAAAKEADACEAAEKLATEAVEAVREGQTEEVVTVSTEAYKNMKEAERTAEEDARRRAEEVLGRKQSETGAETELEKVKAELCGVKDQLDEALIRAERAGEGKLAVEQELRKWRAEHGQRRQKEDGGAVVPAEKGLVSRTGFGFGAGVEVVSEMVKVKKKKSFFPRVLMFFARRKARASAKTG